MLSLRLVFRLVVMGMLMSLPLDASGVEPGEGRYADPSESSSQTGLVKDVSLGFRGVGEIWQDPSLARVHRSSRFAGTGFINVGILRWLTVEGELGYTRMSGVAVDILTGQSTGESTAIEFVPMAFAVCVRTQTDAVELFAGVGPALVAFNDHGPSQVISGAKPGTDIRMGARIHTRMVQESIRPGPRRGVRMMDVELMVGRRQHHMFGIGSGLDLSAWRVGLGLIARL